MNVSNSADKKKASKPLMLCHSTANKHKLHYQLYEEVYIPNKHIVLKLLLASTPLFRIIDPAWPH
jgi:hypothetical protein